MAMWRWVVAKRRSTASSIRSRTIDPLMPANLGN
jgi:hypothetical protein